MQGGDFFFSLASVVGNSFRAVHAFKTFAGNLFSNLEPQSDTNEILFYIYTEALILQ